MRAGDPCPWTCGGKYPIAYRSMMPLTAGRGQSLRIIEPHRFGVCRDCYWEQWDEVYPDEKRPPLPEQEPLNPKRKH